MGVAAERHSQGRESGGAAATCDHRGAPPRLASSTNGKCASMRAGSDLVPRAVEGRKSERCASAPSASAAGAAGNTAAAPETETDRQRAGHLGNTEAQFRRDARRGPAGPRNKDGTGVRGQQRPGRRERDFAFEDPRGSVASSGIEGDVDGRSARRAPGFKKPKARRRKGTITSGRCGGCDGLGAAADRAPRSFGSSSPCWVAAPWPPSWRSGSSISNDPGPDARTSAVPGGALVTGSTKQLREREETGGGR